MNRESGEGRIEIVPDYPNEWLEVARDRARWRSALAGSLTFVGSLWLVRLMQDLADVDLARFGVYPRHTSGLAGVLMAPFIHASWTHLLSNTPPLLILGTALLYGYPKASRIAIPALFVGVGLAVWLFGRPSYHIGASGLSFGIMTFVFTMGVLRWDRRAIALALTVFLLYGAMLAGLAPGQPDVSYESHISGALVGIALAALLRKLDPPPPQKRYSWELEQEIGETYGMPAMWESMDDEQTRRP
ncbi:MAG TPA: rhomboid family intramembrane serine protease [Burkholderiales bacterium]|nr:rhomboid family intramembrane serine protease [Burkholderiales bacterium]